MNTQSRRYGKKKIMCERSVGEKKKLSGKISLIFLTGGPFEMGVIHPIRMESVVVPYGREEETGRDGNRKREETGRERKQEERGNEQQKNKNKISS